MGKAQFLHHSPGRDIACSVERRINDRDLILHLVNRLLVHNLGFHVGNIFVVNLLADHLVLARSQGGSLVRSLHRGQILDRKHFLRHALIVGRRKLGAVLPVYLVAVVLRRIVAGGDIDAGHAAQLTHRKGELRCGAQRFKFVGFDAVGCQRHGCLHGKLRRHMAGVIRDGNALVRGALFDNVVGKALGGPANHIDVHTVDAGSDDAAQACGAELEIHIKAFLDLLLVPLNGPKLCLGSLIEVRIR